jgi:hypothetical protein
MVMRSVVLVIEGMYSAQAECQQDEEHGDRDDDFDEADAFRRFRCLAFVHGFAVWVCCDYCDK